MNEVICTKLSRLVHCSMPLHVVSELGLAGKDLLEEERMEEIAFQLQDYRAPWPAIAFETDPELKVQLFNLRIRDKVRSDQKSAVC